MNFTTEERQRNGGNRAQGGSLDKECMVQRVRTASRDLFTFFSSVSAKHFDRFTPPCSFLDQNDLAQLIFRGCICVVLCLRMTT